MVPLTSGGGAFWVSGGGVWGGAGGESPLLRKDQYLSLNYGPINFPPIVRDPTLYANGLRQYADRAPTIRLMRYDPVVLVSNNISKSIYNYPDLWSVFIQSDYGKSRDVTLRICL